MNSLAVPRALMVTLYALAIVSLFLGVLFGQTESAKILAECEKELAALESERYVAVTEAMASASLYEIKNLESRYSMLGYAIQDRYRDPANSAFWKRTVIGAGVALSLAILGAVMQIGVAVFSKNKSRQMELR